MNKSQTNTQKICEILVSSLDPPKKIILKESREWMIY